MGLSTHHNAENNKYGTLPLRRHLTVAHARLPNGKILKTGFGCMEELQFTSAFIRCGGDCFSMGAVLRRAALLGRHMTVSQDTVLRAGVSLSSTPSGIWLPSGSWAAPPTTMPSVSYNWNLSQGRFLLVVEAGVRALNLELQGLFEVQLCLRGGEALQHLLMPSLLHGSRDGDPAQEHLVALQMVIGVRHYPIPPLLLTALLVDEKLRLGTAAVLRWRDHDFTLRFSWRLFRWATPRLGNRSPFVKLSHFIL